MASVHYNGDVRQARMAAVTAEIDGDATDPGYIEIGTDAAGNFGTLLVTIDLQKPSFGTPSTGTTTSITMAGAPLSGDAVATGTAAWARIRDGGDADVVTGLTVTDNQPASTGDIKLNSIAISAGQTVTLQSGTLSHAA